jgi:hypothetical protein
MDMYDSIYLRKTDDKFYLEFSEWSDFLVFIDRHSSVSPETFYEIMEGNIYKHYSYNGSDEDILHFMQENKESISSFDNVKNIYNELGGIEEDEDDILIDIFKSDIFSNLKNNIFYAFEEYDMILNEDALIKKYKKNIAQHFELTNIYYDNDSKCYIANISKNGTNTLLNNFLAGENLIYLHDEDIYYDYDLELFNGILYDKLYT